MTVKILLLMLTLKAMEVRSRSMYWVHLKSLYDDGEVSYSDCDLSEF